jgi:hypothetical protein
MLHSPQKQALCLHYNKPIHGVLRNTRLSCYSFSDYRLSSNVVYHLFSLHGSLQNYKIHVDVETVNTVHESNKNIFLWSQEVELV